MTNITTVNLTAGVPSGPAGASTVSTIDALMALIGEVTANPTSLTALDRLKTLAATLTTIDGHVDGIEGLIGTTNTTLTTIDGRVDGLEALIGSTNALLTTQNGYLDGLEALITATNAAITAATVGTTVPGTDAANLVGMQGAAGMVPLTTRLCEAANLISGLISTAMTSTTSTAVTGMGVPGSGVRNYITQLTVSNSHATVGTDVELQDGSGGTTFYIVPAAAVYGGSAITFPAPLKQPTANTALYAKNSVTGASVRLSASGYKGA